MIGEVRGYDPRVVARHAPWLTRLVHSYFRADVRGLEQVDDRPALFVGNHSGAAMIPDTLVWMGAYLTAGRSTPLLTLSHDSMFEVYPAPFARRLNALGAIRASRERALEALAEGYAVTVYPGGDQDACRSFSRRHDIVFAGRTGYVELAREAGVPIVPVASVGAHEALLILWDGAPIAKRIGKKRRLAAFPLSLSIPWGFWLGPLPGYVPLPTQISTRVLAPIDAGEGSVEQVDRRVREALQREVRSLAEGRVPVLGRVRGERL